MQQGQHSARCRHWVRGPSSAKTELGDGETELGALPPPWPETDHSSPGLLRPNLLREEGPGGQGWPSGTSHLAPQISPAQYLHQWVGHSQPPRFPLLPLVHGSPDLASRAGITAPPLQPSTAAPCKSRGPVPPLTTLREWSILSQDRMKWEQPFRACCVSEGPCSQPRKDGLLQPAGTDAGVREGREMSPWRGSGEGALLQTKLPGP